jgi:hypothetical protein
LSALSTLANVFEQERQNQIQQQVLGVQANPQAIRDQITADAQSGVTFKDLVNKYRPIGVDANSILQLYQSAGYYKDAQGNPLPLTESPDYLASIGITGQAAKQTKTPTQKVITDAQGNKYFQDPTTGQITPWSQKAVNNPIGDVTSWIQSLFQSPNKTTNSTSTNTTQLKLSLRNQGYTDAQINEYLKLKGLS